MNSHEIANLTQSNGKSLFRLEILVEKMEKILFTQQAWRTFATHSFHSNNNK